MPKYNVKAVERFEFFTYYYDVEADSPEEAVEWCKENGYDEKQGVDDPGEWVETCEVKLSE